ncbi:organic hydroperoxide resistance protein [Actinomycetospora soli]|uniref:organic hydroperoxide resistance protein n=1 Tax=Actinomycetospora soli TaxID=2893887 RepID=UPI001E484E4C|nr:organic hydroperoxide resistance protein [Actinomycetospora soli]MCD2188776.1 organic hydroperoxide resistance protein [Actinomycetospora soli]
MDITYLAEATSTGNARDGHVRSSDSYIDQDVRLPEALGGDGRGTNPEQLFAAGYAACFHQAVKMAAGEKKVSAKDSVVDAEVGLGPDGDSFGIEASITVHLPSLDQETADAVVARAHELCPYSKATRGNVDVSVVALVS